MQTINRTSKTKSESQLDKLADYVYESRFEDLEENELLQLKLRVLDSIACAIGALGYDTVQKVRNHVVELGGNRQASLIGGGETSLDRATLYNSFLVRYLDFNDSYLAPKETCHPSDNLAAILACCEHVNAYGSELLTALAVAYQVQCRLSDEAPVRDKGFDHTTQGAYAAAAGAAKALGLSREEIKHAISISGTTNNSLRVTRTGKISNWKGLAYPDTAASAVHCALMAKHGITGPDEVFEGIKGFMYSIGGKFKIDWSNESFDRVTKTITKKYNAEIHSQSTLEGILRHRQNIDVENIEHITIEIFDVAYNIIGGGDEGNKTEITVKEEADHSLPYMVAVALLDGQVLPSQYTEERMHRDDVQKLIRKINVKPSQKLSQQFPALMPAIVDIKTMDGTHHSFEVDDYEGFNTRPSEWRSVKQKFEVLTRDKLDVGLSKQIVNAVIELESTPVNLLMALLSEIRTNTPEI